MPNKKPTSIALETFIVEKLDAEVDKLGLENRSQVIRHIIREYFKSKSITHP